MFNQLRLFVKSTAVVLLAVCLAALALARQGGEEAKLPDTPAGKTVKEFLKAFNSGDLETMKRFHRERGGNEENAQLDMQHYERSGGLQARKVTRSENYEIEFLAQTKKGGDWLNFVVSVEQQSPHAITGIRAQPAEAPAESTDKKP